MKKHLILFIAAITILGVVFIPGRAYAGDSFEYEVLKDGTAAVTSYSGGDQLVIPDTLDGHKVSAIAKEAFEQKSFKSVTIPAGVVSIDEKAFYHSRISDSLILSGPVSIGKNAFKGAELPEDLIIPAGSKVSEGAFANTDNLEKLLIGEKVIIEEEAFYQSDDLEEIAIMANSTVGENAFQECAETVKLNIEDNCKVSEGAFGYNPSLKEAHIADNAKVDKSAFTGSRPSIDNNVKIDRSRDKNKVTKATGNSDKKKSDEKKDDTKKEEFSFSAYKLILNTNTHKFHQNTCDSVYDIKPKNREGFDGTPEEAMKMGYEPCKKCSSAWAAPKVTQAPSLQRNAVASAGQQYIINTNTGKFHYPSCRSVKQMKDKNKLVLEGTREEIIGMGYDPCQNCDP